MSEMVLLGEDLGMGANKLFGAAGGLQVLSQVATNGTQHLAEGVGLRSRERPMEVKSEAGQFFVGAGAHDFGRPVENLDFDRLTGAPQMRSLLYGSLSKYQQAYGKFEAALDLMVGLPLQMMTGEDATEYTDGVKRWMRGQHTWAADGVIHEVTIGRVRLTPQPVGALFDFVLDEEGQIIRENRFALTKEIGVLSVGFNTLELMVVDAGAPKERFTSGNTVGVRRLLELINRERLYSLGELDSLLRSGKVDLSYALPVWEREVKGEIEKGWGAAFRRFQKVLVVGGGALLLKEGLLAHFRGKAIVPDDPVLAIARGLWKLNQKKR